MHPDPTQEALKAQLLSLGYPWPENLEGKSTRWLEAEIRALAAETDKPKEDEPPQTP
jgi:predicted DNA-binding transcriptional regulator AlpA